MKPNLDNPAVFGACIGSTFRAGDRIEFSLAEVNPLPRSPHAPRSEPFSLIFLGPPNPILPQATYRLTHDQLGELDIFIVPVGPDPQGRIQYEAVFN